MALSGSKHIAILIDSLVGGGAEKVMMTLADTLVHMGHQPHLIAMKQNVDYNLPDAYPVHFLYSSGTARLKGWFARTEHAKNLTELIQEIETKYGRFDGFIANLEETYRIVTATKLTPCVYVIHNSIGAALKRLFKLGPFKYYYLKQTLKLLSDHNVVTVSRNLQEELNTIDFISPKKTLTIYNPFNTADILSLAKQKSNDIPSEDYIIYVGRAAKQKRLDILFQALKLVQSDVKLVCLCKRADKALKIAKHYGVEDRVIFPGFQRNPYPWIKNAKALALSSDYEGFPSVLIEAIICRTIPVSTDCPHGANEILTGALKDFLVPLGDYVQLAKKIDLAITTEFSDSFNEVVHKVNPNNAAQAYLDFLDDIAR